MTNHRIPWDDVQWACPSCDGALAPIDHQNRDEFPDDEQTYYRNPAVVCNDCDQ